jgi:hypothetical protein
MKRMLGITAIGMLFVGSILGCSQRSDQAQSTTSDSLFAANPSEPAAGTLTPEQQFQPESSPPPSEPAVAPAPRKPAPKPAPAPKRPAQAPGVTLPAGTAMKLTVDAALTSETAQLGDTWTGTVKDAVIIGTAAPIPAGSKITGTVVGVQPAGGKSVRAFLVLRVNSVDVMGKTHAVHASADTLWAASATARNTGAIAGSAAAGALLGKAIGGSGKGAVIGGVIGGAAAAGAVLKSKGYQSIVKEGTELTFHTTDALVMRQ